jgi:2-isopropylmalate synthase
MSISAGMNQNPTAVVTMKIDGETHEKSASGDGPVDAAFQAITSITGAKSRLLKYEVKAITGGTDALGEVVCTLEEDDRSVSGHGADTDIIIASARAYINALNKLAARKK